MMGSMRLALRLIFGLLPVSAASAGVNPPTIQFIPQMEWVHGVSDDGTTVVGNTSGAGAYYWTYDLGAQFIGGQSVVPGASYVVGISGDGSTIGGDAVGDDGKIRASRWIGGTSWENLPAFSDSSTVDGHQTSFHGINADGSVIVGLGWSFVTGGALGRVWNTGGTNQTVMSVYPGTSTRLNGTNDLGTVHWGWNASPSGAWYGLRRANGVSNLITYSAPGGATHNCGEAMGGSPSGHVLVGRIIFSSGLNAGWRWDQATNTTTPIYNASGFSGSPFPADVTADGAMIVGTTGGLPPGRQALLWIGGASPIRLYDWLLAQGTVGLTDYTELGNAIGITPDGRFIVGWGSGVAGTPLGGWIVDTDPATPCPADINGDGEVSSSDLAAVLAEWGGCFQSTCPSDLNFDGFVDANDLSILLSAWGLCP